MTSLTVHIWSDVACPWCYLGKKRFEEALRRTGTAAEIHWHSFELDPRPRTAESYPSYVDWLSNKHGIPLPQAESMIANMVKLGGEEGIAFDFETAVPANTFDAHRVLHLAHSVGGTELQKRLKARFLAAHFSEGRDLNRHDELASLAGELEIDVDRVSAVLQSDEFAAAVRADEDQARQMGIGGVPFFVVGELGVSGAQRPETFEQVIRRAL